MTDYRTAPRRTNESPLARIRIARGLTQGQLAEKVGCRQKDISRWESGTKPGADYLLKLTSSLDCRIEDIME